jgi:hypothetical protein
MCDILRHPDGPGGTEPHINGRITADFRDPSNGSRQARKYEIIHNGKRDVGRLETTVAPPVLCTVLAGGRVRGGAR